MLMTSGPSGGAALKPTRFGGGYYYMVWGTLRPDTVYHLIYKCKLRLYHAKEKPTKNQQHAGTLSGFHLIRDGAECPLAPGVPFQMCSKSHTCSLPPTLYVVSRGEWTTK